VSFVCFSCFLFKGKYSVSVVYASHKIRTFDVLFLYCYQLRFVRRLKHWLCLTLPQSTHEPPPPRELCHKLVCKYNFTNFSCVNLKTYPWLTVSMLWSFQYTWRYKCFRYDELLRRMPSHFNQKSLKLIFLTYISSCRETFPFCSWKIAQF
jgi:hypothetical protein